MKKRSRSKGVWVLLGVAAVAVLALVVARPQAATAPEANRIDLLRESPSDNHAKDQGDASSDFMLTEDKTTGSSAAAPVVESLTDSTCPVAFPEPHSPITYRRGINVETWNAQVEGSCQECARTLLYSLYDAGTSLVEAGYLDLFGAVWGCVAQSETLGALTITIESRPTASGPSSYPESLYAASPYRSSHEWCEVTMVRTFIPEMSL